MRIKIKLFPSVASVEDLIGFILIFLSLCCVTYEAIAARGLLFHNGEHPTYICYIEGIMCFATACVLVVLYLQVKPQLDEIKKYVQREN